MNLHIRKGSKSNWQNHPFIVYGNVGTLKELKRMGFRTFSPFIDESYDLTKYTKKNGYGI